MAEEEEEGIASRCWKKHEKESVVHALFKPFFVCLAAGNLNPMSFRHFISQNLHFLKAFVKAYDKVEECADDDDDKKLIHDLSECIVKMIQTYQTTVEKWGFGMPKSEGVPDSMATKYNQFFLRTASGIVDGEQVIPCEAETPFEKTKVAAYALAAIAPFMRLYAHLSHRIIPLTQLDRDRTSDHIYKKWLQYYSSQEILALAKKTEDVLDKFSVSLTKEDLTIIAKLYDQAMKLQLEFFASQPKFQRNVVPLSSVQDLDKSKLSIFSAFGSTCSVVHPHVALIRMAIHSKTSPADLNLKEKLGDIARQRKQAYKQCTDNLVLSVMQEIEFDYESLCAVLEQVEMIEKWANANVEASGAFKDLSLEGIQEAGQNLVLHNGCREFFEKVMTKKDLSIDVHVITNCWSGNLIRSAFSSDLQALNIQSNELVYNEESVTTGEIVKKVESPFDKLQAFRDVVEGHKSSSSSCSRDQGHTKHLKVCIGGSSVDLLCLVEADIGIVFGSKSETLRKLGNHCGVKFVPLLHGVVKNQRGVAKWKPKSGFLYTVDSWAEIQAFILGCN
ncbi:heme oxygenase [Parasponia andersonii]|uniref:Heme oxygenase n=1 Tax=Parasponia andersonii TaxID=3476 RepID=A0A2P5DN23_PARAD|nr:heme oxygenase [Parasponia andersonii]